MFNLNVKKKKTEQNSDNRRYIKKISFDVQILGPW